MKRRSLCRNESTIGGSQYYRSHAKFFLMDFVTDQSDNFENKTQAALDEISPDDTVQYYLRGPLGLYTDINGERLNSDIQLLRTLTSFKFRR